MRRLKTSIAAWSAAGAAGTYWIVDYLIPHDRMVELASNLVLGITLACLIRYTREAAIAMRDGRGGADFLLVATWSTMLILFINRIYIILLDVYDRPYAMLNSSLGPFIVWMLAWACTMFLLAPDAENGNIPPVSRMLIGLALFTAGLVSGIGVMLSFAS